MSTEDSIVKQKIRERYKGVDIEELDVIPAIPQEDFYKSQTKKRVAVYARVSTDDPNQTSSYELQKNYYEDLVNRHESWDLVDIYADEGISGTSLQHRDNFIRMIGDCDKGDVDLIVTKSVSRFARNIIDCIGIVRRLKEANPPIGVFFETENIYTLNENSEMSLSFISTLAQEESHTKSEIMNSSIEMRFKRGIFLTPVLLGYDHDEDGNLVINEDEANTVRLIFFSYLYGYTSQQIADALTQLERKTKKGSTVWSPGSIIGILSNERYCGDILARKTFTPNYLNHKSKKNKHDRNQYRKKNHHDPIITRDDFFAVQKLIRNRKYGNKRYFPEMYVISEGILKGYVSVHPKWAGFTEEDYYIACGSISDEMMKNPSVPYEVHVKKGSLDFTGYEVVRKQFMSEYKQPIISFSDTTLSFSSGCFEKLFCTQIELFVHPGKKMIAVRKSHGESRHKMTWCKVMGDKQVPKGISGRAFLPTLYLIFGWRIDCRYRILGNLYKKGNDSVLIFDTKNAVKYILPEDKASENRKKKKRMPAYPKSWAYSFGDSYYKTSATYDEQLPDDDTWNVQDKGHIHKFPEKSVTTPEQAAKNIETILENIGAKDE